MRDSWSGQSIELTMAEWSVCICLAHSFCNAITNSCSASVNVWHQLDSNNWPKSKSISHDSLNWLSSSDIGSRLCKIIHDKHENHGITVWWWWQKLTIWSPKEKLLWYMQAFPLLQIKLFRGRCLASNCWYQQSIRNMIKSMQTWNKNVIWAFLHWPPLQPTTSYCSCALRRIRPNTINNFFNDVAFTDV